MSLPTTGHFAAETADLTLSFDGVSWTLSDHPGRAFYLSALQDLTLSKTGTHITCVEVGRSVLDTLFPGAWQETSARVDTWGKELPEDAID